MGLLPAEHTQHTRTMTETIHTHETHTPPPRCWPGQRAVDQQTRVNLSQHITPGSHQLALDVLRGARHQRPLFSVGASVSVGVSVNAVIIGSSGPDPGGGQRRVRSSGRRRPRVEAPLEVPLLRLEPRMTSKIEGLAPLSTAADSNETSRRKRKRARQRKIQERFQWLTHSSSRWSAWG